MTTYHENPMATVTAGTLRLAIWYAEDRQEDDGGTRRAYAYRIDDTDLTDKAYEDSDLESGVGADIDVHAALQTLISFLQAAADAYRYAMNNPSTSPENLSLFPTWVGESAYTNDTELSVLVVPDEAEQDDLLRSARGAPTHSLPQDPIAQTITEPTSTRGLTR